MGGWAAITLAQLRRDPCRVGAPNFDDPIESWPLFDQTSRLGHVSATPGPFGDSHCRHDRQTHCCCVLAPMPGDEIQGSKCVASEHRFDPHAVCPYWAYG